VRRQVSAAPLAHNEAVTAVPAHELTRTFDCAVPGCPREAEVAGGLCRNCTQVAREQAREGAPAAGKLETGALALVGLARELDAELRAWHMDVEEARDRLAGR
jgi:hypothetical protein